MSNYYVVAIEVRKHADQKFKQTKYIKVNKYAGTYPLMTLVLSKSSATKFEREGLAAVISNYFWDNYWRHRYKTDGPYYDLRETLQVKGRK